MTTTYKSGESSQDKTLFVRAGEKRNPKAGEWYLSGAIPQAWKAHADYDTAYHILRVATAVEIVSIGELLAQLRQRFVDDPATRDQIAREGLSLNAMDYWQDVRDFAEELEAGCKDGTIGDQEALDQTLYEAVDGAARVIYTHEAIQCMMHSDNSGIGPEECGADAFDWSDGVPWSQLAFYAFRADIQDRLPDADDLFSEDEEDDEPATPEHDD